MEKRILIIGLVLLFIFSSVVPISIGYDVKIPNNKMQSSNRGNTLYVGGNGPNNYTRIQDALDDAINGDTVFVYSGTYYEFRIWINTSINLIGENKNSTCIDGQNKNGIIILIVSSNVKVTEFTLRNCYIGSGLGQAIYLWGNNTHLDNIYISDCIINKCDKGIFLININNLTIINCSFYNLHGQTIWGYSGNSNIIICDCIAYKNGVNVGGGVIPGSITFDSSYSNIHIFNCTIHDIYGPGILISGGGDKVNISQNNIYQNSWHGVEFYSYLSLIKNINLNNNHIYKNHNNGVFISGITYPGIEIYNNNISYNGNEESCDGGIFFQNCDNHTIDIKNNSISSNKGQGIYPVTIPGINIIGNDIIKNTQDGIYLHDGSKDSIINGNNISENKVGIFLGFDTYSVSGNIISNNGIGINIFRSNNVIYNNEISNNDDGINILCYNFYVNGGGDNYIYSNNFINNKRNAFFTYYFDFSNLYPIKTKFNGNYWDKARLLPKSVPGQLKLFSNWIPGGVNFSWMIFDLNPVNTPNDINKDFNVPTFDHTSSSEESRIDDKVSIEENNISIGFSPPLFVKKVKSTQQEP